MDALPDVIDALVGIAAGSRLDAIRRQRTQARENAQASYLALFQPTDPGEVTLGERHAIAVFVAGLHRQPEIAAFYAEGLVGRQDGKPVAATIVAEAARGAGRGPYGHYPPGPLSGEDSNGPSYAPTSESAVILGRRLSAAFSHAHMLVFHPRDAAPAALQALLDAGWSSTGIVTISQLVSFLSFQIRVIAGLRSLADVAA
jgi:CMD domain protein